VLFVTLDDDVEQDFSNDKTLSFKTQDEALAGVSRWAVECVRLANESGNPVDYLFTQIVPRINSEYTAKTVKKSVMDYLVDSYRFYRYHTEEDLGVAKMLALRDCFEYAIFLHNGVDLRVRKFTERGY
jgi:hypothetical protein